MFTFRNALAIGLKLHVNMPSGKVLVALIPLFVLLGGLILYCLIDLVRAPSVRFVPKGVWALVIVLGSAPCGPLAYLIFGKDRSGRAPIDDVAQADGGADEPAERREFASLGS